MKISTSRINAIMSNKYNWPVVGHDKIKNFLQNSIEKDNPAHAYLFHGCQGIGKVEIAMLFAKSLICLKQGDSLPCNHCRSCEQFDKLVYPDLFILEREMNEKTDKKKQFVTVNQVRDLQEKINKRAFLNSYKIVIIKEAHLLNKESSNSLLKTLEEPTQKTIIILVTDNKEAILPTIISRCQLIKFQPVDRDSIYSYLVDEKQVDRTTAKEIARIVNGRANKADEYQSDSEKFQNDKQLNRDLLDLLKKSLTQRFATVDKLIRKGSTIEEVNSLFDKLIVLFRDLILINSENSNLIVNIYLENELTALAKSLSSKKIVSNINILEKAKELVQKNVNSKLVFENVLVYL